MKLLKKAPNTHLILSSIILLVAIFSWIIPAGEYSRHNFEDRQIVDAESFRFVESNPQFVDDVLTAPIKGFTSAALIIGFVLIVGGAFAVFQKTEAVDALILSIAKAHRKSKLVQKMMIPILMTLFSLGGAVFGMSEEVIPFILVFVPLSLYLGYDSVTGAAIPHIGAALGFAAAFINPFTLGVAQGIAGLTPLSGMGFRIICWLIITLTGIWYVSKYAAKIRKNPELSPSYENDKLKREKLNLEKLEKFNGIDRQHKLVLSVFALGMIVLVAGVLEFGWYIEEICAVFIATGIAVGMIGGLPATGITNSFIKGAKDLIGTALIIALARGILVVAEEGKIIDTILFALSSSIDSFHPVVSSQAMFAIQSIINFFIPSGSGQAALTMPIMAPLGDIVGVSRQTTVLAFQFGDGFTNLIIPTSAVTMGVLSLAGIPWEKWARWILKLEITLFIIGLLLLIPPYFMNW